MTMGDRALDGTTEFPVQWSVVPRTRPMRSSEDDPGGLDPQQSAWIERAREGHRRSFEKLWKRHAAFVHMILLSMVDPHEIPDLMQDVAMAAWSGVTQLEHGDRFRSWLAAIARNRGRDARRKLQERWNVTEASEDELHEVLVPAEADACAQADEALEHLRQLPRCYREPLTLRLVGQWSGAEIAAHLDMTQGSVRVNLHRGMTLLRKSLGREE